MLHENKESTEQVVIRERYYWDLEILLDVPAIMLVPKAKAVKVTAQPAQIYIKGLRQSYICLTLKKRG